MYKKLLKDNKLDVQPGRIIKSEKTGVTTDRVHNKVYVAKGSRDAYLKSPVCGNSNYSVLFCVSATGLYRMEGCSESGWMMDNI